MNQTHTAEDRIRDFVRKHFPLAVKNGIKPNEKWLESGMIDSLGILDLVHFLEEEFSLHITDDELMPEYFESLEAVTEFVRKKTEAKS
jgi:acyl carrier protein